MTKIFNKTEKKFLNAEKGGFPLPLGEGTRFLFSHVQCFFGSGLSGLGKETRMKNRLFTALLIGMASLGALYFIGCGGISSEYIPPQIIIPPYIKTIAVRPFANTTSEPDIGNKLWLATTQEFIRDGRIKYNDDENKADGVVVGTIKQFVETELSHDVNLVALEYQIWVVMDLKFLDRLNNQYLWEEPLIEEKFRYFTETAPGGMTKEQAKTQLWDRFATDIIRRTIEGYGSVTSASPKSIPKTPPPEQPAPPYIPTNPY